MKSGNNFSAIDFDNWQWYIILTVTLAFSPLLTDYICSSPTFALKKELIVDIFSLLLYLCVTWIKQYCYQIEIASFCSEGTAKVNKTCKQNPLSPKKDLCVQSFNAAEVKLSFSRPAVCGFKRVSSPEMDGRGFGMFPSFRCGCNVNQIPFQFNRIFFVVIIYP